MYNSIINRKYDVPITEKERVIMTHGEFKYFKKEVEKVGKRVLFAVEQPNLNLIRIERIELKK